ncbi:hypothetical protein LAZ67_18001828 [Cordylochernes scorpioides]|uniref:Uncharacterized protein n=1 Tax=Cordylochernes scorpioides TaxID=51811 RepID=A0ABY6LKB7_9ARAC|nr:hypothetical protein LAZ67_18001828 [Cordylochernes scorpioides]
MGPLLHARNQTAVEALGKSLWFNTKESKVVCFVMSKRDPVNYYLENGRTITGREWGADATTLKFPHTSVITPILGYRYQIYGRASETNLKSLEKSAARYITGLQNSCPNDIVLYEAVIEETTIC